MGIILAVVLSSLGDMGGEALSWESCRGRVFTGLICKLGAKELGLAEPKTLLNVSGKGNSAGLMGSFSAGDGDSCALLVTSTLPHSSVGRQEGEDCSL